MHDRKVHLMVEVHHDAHIHLIDVVGAPDKHIVGSHLAQQVDVLVNGVGGAAKPGGPAIHGRRRALDVLVEES